jgi:hypothetical protein
MVSNFVRIRNYQSEIEKNTDAHLEQNLGYVGGN